MDTEKTRNNVRTASGINIAAGVWLLASPFVLGFADSVDALWNFLIVGLIVLVLAAIRISQWAEHAWMSWVNVGLGVWLIIAPFIMGFGNTVMWNSIIAGLVVAAMGGWSASASQSGSQTQARA